METIYHMHHIIPKYMGGDDSESNLVKLTVEEHAEAHKKLYEEHGNWEDYVAWQGLSKMINRQDIIKYTMTKAGLKGNKVRTEKYHANPEWAAEIRKKQSKPKSTTENYFKPKSDEHKENMRKAALKRERFPCSKCGKTFTKANLAKHENSCNE